MSGISVIAVLCSILIMIALVFVYASRIKIVGPNQVLIVSGRSEPPDIVTGGRRFIWPLIERVDELSLEIMTINLSMTDMLTVKDEQISVEGAAQIKIGSDEFSIRTAAIQLLSKSHEEIQHISRETLAGHLRDVVSVSTSEQLKRDGEAFAQKVHEVSSEDMASMGLEIVSFVLIRFSEQKG